MGRVFIAEEPVKRTERQGMDGNIVVEYVPRIPNLFSSAGKHGKPVVLFKRNPFTQQDAKLEVEVHRAREILRDYNPEEDFIHCVGNPNLIGTVVALAAFFGGGKVQMLQWSRREEALIPYTVDLYSQELEFVEE